ncbi:TPA: HIT family protein [Pseudomonas aeruginosa]|uniref:HIT family protein n=1 Tax=Pseudomonas aeruginosa TaxID=287 RepID=UPI0020CD5EFC|nr:HIT family protein [Pseudomonas aeruginosa]
MYSDDMANIIADAYPVSPGHLLITPRCHYPTLFDVPAEEQRHLLSLINQAKDLIGRFHCPDGYNVGINNGAAAGQTVPHVHIHVIPRYDGDAEDPRGRVRWVIPDKAKYWP